LWGQLKEKEEKEIKRNIKERKNKEKRKIPRSAGRLNQATQEGYK
jgi:hypothetical protein